MLHNTNRKLFINHFSRRPFPIDKHFYGQTFVIGGLTRCAEGHKNKVWSKSKSLPEEWVRVSKKIGQEKLNTQIVFGYPSNCKEEKEIFFNEIASAIKDGYIPVLVFHYPFKDRNIIKQIHEDLSKADLRRECVVVGYYHVLADYAAELATNNSNGKNQAVEDGKRFVEISASLDRLFAVSDAVKESFRELLSIGGFDFPEGFVDVVRNGVDSFLYAPPSKKEMEEMRAFLSLSNEVRKLVCFSGRLDYIKGIKTLISILRRFEESNSSEDKTIGFVIATGDLIDERKKDIIDQILECKRLITTGRLKLVIDVAKFVRGDERFIEEISPLFDMFMKQANITIPSDAYGGLTPFPIQRASDIVLLPSISEALSLSLVEGALSGAYLVGSNVGGIPYVISKHKNGRVVEVDAVDDYVKAIREGERTSKSQKKVDWDERAMFKTFKKKIYDIYKVGDVDVSSD